MFNINNLSTKRDSNKKQQSLSQMIKNDNYKKQYVGKTIIEQVKGPQKVGSYQTSAIK